MWQNHMNKQNVLSEIKRLAEENGGKAAGSQRFWFLYTFIQVLALEERHA